VAFAFQPPLFNIRNKPQPAAIFTYIFTYIYTYIYTYIHTYKSAFPCPATALPSPPRCPTTAVSLPNSTFAESGGAAIMSDNIENHDNIGALRPGCDESLFYRVAPPPSNCRVSTPLRKRLLHGSHYRILTPSFCINPVG